MKNKKLQKLLEAQQETLRALEEIKKDETLNYLGDFADKQYKAVSEQIQDLMAIEE